MLPRASRSLQEVFVSEARAEMAAAGKANPGATFGSSRLADGFSTHHLLFILHALAPTSSDSQASS
ncbi:hypothetical protein HPP92_010426 [Vanilla planifolia]|uniref:Uncharacterized protein n=1 Tax=Vanilla planifolia TaxID=51239 RepID=A0A835R434_VANPL|nr:hypothetical protein HPP92_010426 [Vanilla planifolia]